MFFRRSAVIIPRAMREVLYYPCFEKMHELILYPERHASGV
jgi:hypothetical protein